MALADYQETAVAAWRHALAETLPETTISRYARYMRRFAGWLAKEHPEISLAAVRRADVVEYRDVLMASYAPATTHLHLASIKSFYYWAVDAGHLDRSPAERVKLPGKRTDASRQPYAREELTDDEIRAVLHTCGDGQVDRRDRAILALMAYTGLRTVEIHRANFEHLQTRKGRMVLWVQRKGRAAVDGYVILPPAAEQALRDYLQDHPRPGGPLFVSLNKGRHQRLTKNTIRRMVKRRLRRCGINSPTKTTHSLRHSAVTNALRHGANVAQLQAMTGHTDPKTLLRYYHQHDRISDAAEDRIDYDPPDSD